MFYHGDTGGPHPRYDGRRDAWRAQTRHRSDVTRLHKPSRALRPPRKRHSKAISPFPAAVRDAGPNPFPLPFPSSFPFLFPFRLRTPGNPSAARTPRGAALRAA
ncbi:unnamed protein product [Coccothraustes coccothraustes]